MTHHFEHRVAITVWRPLFRHSTNTPGP
jgi:hypothetical protein